MSKDSSAKYYYDNKKRLQEKLMKDIKASIKKKMKKKWKDGREIYKQLQEKEKQMLVDYSKKYYKTRKKALL